MSDKVKIAILISGRGSNMLAIVGKVLDGTINGEVLLVISNNAGAEGLVRASELGIETLYLDHRNFDSREEYDREIISNLKKKDIELVCLAGFMRLLSPHFTEEYSGRIMNVHPSLLPSFPGVNGQQLALDYGVKITGCTVHFVDEKLDHGPIILQKTVPVEDSDTLELLSSRILEQEHIAYPEAVKLYCDRKITIDGRKVITE